MARLLDPMHETAPSAPDLKILKRYFTEARDLTAVARTKSLTCIDYYDGDQFTPDQLDKLHQRGQPPVVINRLKVAINGIIGVTERGRSDPRAWPRNPGDEGSADAATDVLRFIADFNKLKRLKQDCFWDMLVPGTMAALVGVDDDLQVTITQVRWEEFFADPRSRRRDWKDARFLGIAKWMYADDAAALYPAKAEAIEATVANGVGGGMAPDASYQDRPLNAPGTAGAWVDRRQGRLMVVEIFYRQDGWRRCVFTGADILDDGESPYLDHRGRPDCPIEAMSAYVRRDNARYGAAWDMLGVQDEINKRRGKALHLLTVSRIEASDPQAIDVDRDVARKEAARPDGVLPLGWKMSPNTAEMAGNLELLQEAKGEIERLGPNPAVVGRDGADASGRALLARQQGGLIELANLYGALEDWELRLYRQCWARARQFWRAPQFIRVTDDEDAPRFVGLNQPVTDAAGAVLGYRNAVAEMDVDIEVDTQAEVGTIAAEQFSDLMRLVGANPAWAAQVPLDVLIQLSSIPHKRSVIDLIKAARQGAQAQGAQTAALEQAGAAAKVAETRAKAGMHAATGFSKALDSLAYAHEVGAAHAARGLERGLGAGGANVPEPGEAGDAGVPNSGT